MEVPLIGVSLLSVAKLFILFALVLYLVFALVVIRQVQLMTETVEVGFEAPIRFLSYIHLAFAVLVFLVALIAL